MDEGAEWHPNDQVMPVFSMLVFAATVFSTFGAEVMLIDKITQGAELRVGTKYNTTTVAPIAAVRSSTGAVFLTQEADATTSAIPGFHVNPDLINKVHIGKKPLAGLGKERKLAADTAAADSLRCSY
jgi:hypothetical protein